MANLKKIILKNCKLWTVGKSERNKKIWKEQVSETPAVHHDKLELNGQVTAIGRRTLNNH